MILYDHSTGEIRARAFDEAQTEITSATLTCTLYDGRQRPRVVFSDRVMAYSGSHPFSGTNDLGCYFCTVSSTELSGADGLWKAVITTVDGLGNTLVTTAFIDVIPFVLG